MTILSYALVLWVSTNSAAKLSLWQCQLTLRSRGVLKPCAHKGQVCGRASLCLFICIRKLLRVLDSLSQCGQANSSPWWHFLWIRSIFSFFSLQSEQLKKSTYNMVLQHNVYAHNHLLVHLITIILHLKKIVLNTEIPLYVKFLYLAALFLSIRDLSGSWHFEWM
jgi:hypothetical protein